LKILLFGKNGQLGWELQQTLAPLGEVCAVDRAELDLQDVSALDALIRAQRPQAIVNASAYTAVDRAEQERDLAFQVNAHAPRVMAEAARALNAVLIHYSTDYVFDGQLGRPYVENDTPNPLNVYGRSKLAGEQAVQQAGGVYLIFRTAWVYSLRGDSFVRKVLQWSRSQPALKIVSDQVSNPTWARSLAEITGSILAGSKGELFDYVEEKRGIYHLAGSGYASRLEWAREILQLDPRKEEQTARELQPASTSDFPTPAQRPLFSALDCARFEAAFGLSLPDWKVSLRSAMGFVQ